MERGKNKKSVPDEFEDFGFGALPLLHPLLHGRDDDLRFILGAVLGTLLGRPFARNSSHFQKELENQ